jgi:hypothetical protein
VNRTATDFQQSETISSISSLTLNAAATDDIAEVKRLTDVEKKTSVDVQARIDGHHADSENGRAGSSPDLISGVDQKIEDARQVSKDLTRRIEATYSAPTVDREMIQVLNARQVDCDKLIHQYAELSGLQSEVAAARATNGSQDSQKPTMPPHSVQSPSQPTKWAQKNQYPSPPVSTPSTPSVPPTSSRPQTTSLPISPPTSPPPQTMFSQGPQPNGRHASMPVNAFHPAQTQRHPSLPALQPVQTAPAAPTPHSPPQPQRPTVMPVASAPQILQTNPAPAQKKSTMSKMSKGFGNWVNKHPKMAMGGMILAEAAGATVGVDVIRDAAFIQNTKKKLSISQQPAAVQQQAHVAAQVQQPQPQQQQAHLNTSAVNSAPFGAANANSQAQGQRLLQQQQAALRQQAALQQQALAREQEIARQRTAAEQNAAQQQAYADQQQQAPYSQGGYQQYGNIQQDGYPQGYQPQGQYYAQPPPQYGVVQQQPAYVDNSVTVVDGGSTVDPLMMAVSFSSP